MYWENQPELPSDKGSNWSRGATRDIGSPPLTAFVKKDFCKAYNVWLLNIINYHVLYTLFGDNSIFYVSQQLLQTVVNYYMTVVQFYHSFPYCIF